MNWQEWFEANKKYIYGADVDAWCEIAWDAAIASVAAPEQLEPEIEYYGLEPWEVAANVPVATMIYPKHSPDKPFVALGNCVSLYPEAAQVKLLYTTPQPTAPEPVNQMLLAALNACADALCNSQNFILSISSDGFGAVCAEANGIAIDMANEILDAAEQAPQPTELTKPFQPDWANYQQGYANGRDEAMEAAEKYVKPYQWLLKQKASPSTTPYGECTLTFDVEGEARHAWGRAVEAGKGMTACIEAAIAAHRKETK